MPWLVRQLEFGFESVDALTSIFSTLHPVAIPGRTRSAGERISNKFRKGRDPELEQQARELLRSKGATRIANDVRVEWNPRLKSCAGRADYGEKLISLNPLLRAYSTNFVKPEVIGNELDRTNRSSLTSGVASMSGVAESSAAVHDEVDRTLRHELAHLLAQFRAGRRRIRPHGQEWRAACVDLGIGGEKRRHNLSFPVIQRARQFLYRCPGCNRRFSRVRKIRSAIACLACCRAHNRGKFDPRFRLKLASRQ